MYDTHNQHCISDLMFAHSSTKDDHPCLFGGPRQLVEASDILHDVDHKSRVPERVEIDHVSKGAICQRRAEHRNVILGGQARRRDDQS